MTGNTTAPHTSRRTTVVWASFLAAMTLVTGILAMGDDTNRSGFLATSVARVGDPTARDPIFDTETPLDRQRWTGIVIHHLGEPAGDAESINRLHLGYGYQGLGYHFLIGNGNGLGDGVVHIGYRWNEQLPGAHAVGPDADVHNQSSIAICLVGNGNRRPFTDAQVDKLGHLVQRLQRELRIPARRVLLHQEIAEDVDSPGRFFPAARFHEQLLDLTR